MISLIWSIDALLSRAIVSYAISHVQFFFYAASILSTTHISNARINRNLQKIEHFEMAKTKVYLMQSPSMIDLNCLDLLAGLGMFRQF